MSNAQDDFKKKLRERLYEVAQRDKASTDILGDLFGGAIPKSPPDPKPHAAVERGLKLETGPEASRSDLGLWFRGFAQRVALERGAAR